MHIRVTWIEKEVKMYATNLYIGYEQRKLPNVIFLKSSVLSPSFPFPSFLSFYIFFQSTIFSFLCPSSLYY
jgi:hypothetical protein